MPGLFAWGAKVNYVVCDAEVYDNGVLVYSRQLKTGIEKVKHLGFTRAGDYSIKVDRLYFKAVPRSE